MNKNKKNYYSWRILSLLLAVFIIMASMPITVFAGVTDVDAGTTRTTTVHTYYTKVDAHAKIEIIAKGHKQGDSENEWAYVNKTSNYLEGNLTDKYVKDFIAAYENEIKKDPGTGKSRGNFIDEKTESTREMKFDYYESSYNYVKNGAILVGTIDELEKIYAADGTVERQLNLDEYQVYQINEYYVVDLNDQEITNIDIQNATLSYKAGEKPQATATKNDEFASHYTLSEEWLELSETNANDVSRIWSSDKDANWNIETFDTFAEGKSYQYSLTIMPEDGYIISDNVSVTLNGKKIDTSNAKTSRDDENGALYIYPLFEEEKTPVVDTIKIGNANLNLTPGTKPGTKDDNGTTFTAKSLEEDKYYVYLEEWYSESEKKVFTSSNFFNRDNLFEEFVEGKEYLYDLWIKPKEDANNKPLVTFADTLKVILNGKEYTIDASNIQDMGDSGIWINNITKVTPSSKSSTDKKEPTDTNTTVNETVDKNTTKETEKTSNNPKTGDNIIVMDTKTPINETVDKVDNKDNNSTKETVEKISNNPQTGDNIIVMISIFTVAVLGMVITVRLNKSKKRE